MPMLSYMNRYSFEIDSVRFLGNIELEQFFGGFWTSVGLRAPSLQHLLNRGADFGDCWVFSSIQYSVA
jgi:hypothetical protein